MPVPQIVDSPLLDGVDAAGRALLAAAAEARELPAGTDVIREGERSQYLFLVESGSLLVTSAGRGGLAHLGPGECFGEVTVFTEAEASATVSTVTGVRLQAIAHEDVRRLIDAVPVLARNFCRLLGSRVASAAHPLTGNTVVLMCGAEGEGLALALNLAASSAWHLRREAAVVDLDTDTGPVPEIRQVSERVLCARAGGVSPGEVTALLDALSVEYPFVLVWASVARAGRLRPLYAPERRVLAVGMSRALTAQGLVLPEHAEAVILGVPEPHSRRVAAGLQATTGRRVAGMLPGTPAPLNGAEPAPDWVLRNREAPFSRAVGRLARTLTGKTVGLAFGCGAGRGFAHAGALAALERLGVRADMVAGTSVGAGVALLYTMGCPPEDVAGTMQRFGQVIRRRSLSMYSLMAASGLDEAFRSWIPESLSLEDLPLPTAFVAADLDTGEEVLLERGSAWKSARASASVPGFFPPARLDNRLLVDGGVVSPVPCRALRELGADVTIGISLESPAVANGGDKRPPTWPAALLRAFDLYGNSLIQHCMQFADVPVRAFTPPVAVTDFRGGPEFLEAGERAVAAAEERLKSLLPWL